MTEVIRRGPKFVTIPFDAKLFDQVRKEAGFTVQALADKASVSVDTLRGELKVSRIKPERLQVLVDILDQNQETEHYIYTKKVAITVDYFKFTK